MYKALCFILSVIFVSTNVVWFLYSEPRTRSDEYQKVSKESVEKHRYVMPDGVPDSLVHWIASENMQSGIVADQTYNSAKHLWMYSDFKDPKMCYGDKCFVVLFYSKSDTDNTSILATMTSRECYMGIPVSGVVDILNHIETCNQ